MIIIVSPVIWFSFLAAAEIKKLFALRTVFSLFLPSQGWGKEQPCVILETLIDDKFQTNRAGEPTDCRAAKKTKKNKKKSKKSKGSTSLIWIHEEIASQWSGHKVQRLPGLRSRPRDDQQPESETRKLKERLDLLPLTGLQVKRERERRRQRCVHRSHPSSSRLTSYNLCLVASILLL